MNPRGRIAAVAVVVPARDEEELLPGCLDAITAAAQRIEVPVSVVVTLDRCRDGTADVVAARPDVTAVECDAGVVGMARAAGVGAAPDLDTGEPGGALDGSIHRCRSGIQRQQVVAAGGQLSREDADRAARLEGAAKALARQGGESERALAAFVPAVGEPPRVIAAGGVEVVEEGGVEAVARCRVVDGSRCGRAEEDLDIALEVAQQRRAEEHLVARSP